MDININFLVRYILYLEANVHNSNNDKKNMDF